MMRQGSENMRCLLCSVCFWSRYLPIRVVEMQISKYVILVTTRDFCHPMPIEKCIVLCRFVKLVTIFFYQAANCINKIL